MCALESGPPHTPQQKKAKHKLIHSVNPRRGGGNLELHAWHLPFNPTFTPFTIKLSPFLSNSFLFFFFLLLWSEEPSLPLLCPMGSLPPSLPPSHSLWGPSLPPFIPMDISKRDLSCLSSAPKVVHPPSHPLSHSLNSYYPFFGRFYVLLGPRVKKKEI